MQTHTRAHTCARARTNTTTHTLFPSPHPPHFLSLPPSLPSLSHSRRRLDLGKGEDRHVLRVLHGLRAARPDASRVGDATLDSDGRSAPLWHGHMYYLDHPGPGPPPPLQGRDSE